MSSVTADVGIIGGGLTGCATAYHLARRGARVVLLERGFVGAQSSGVNFGNLRLQGRYLRQLPLALRAQRLWEELEAEIGESVEFSQTGHVLAAVTPAHVAEIETHAVDCKPYGLDVEILDRRETLRRWPFLGEIVIGSSWSPRDATVNSRLVCPALARAARRHGADIREQVSVTAVEQAAGGAFRVVTDQGFVLDCGHLVNAAGAWAAPLAAQFGEEVPAFAAGPVQMVTEPLPRFLDPVIHAVDGGILFRQTARGNVLIAGHPRVPVDAESRRTRVPPQKATINMARLAKIAPFLRTQNIIRMWTGIEGYLPDMLPVFGPSRTTPGLLHAFAFCGHGLQIGPAVGAVLAELILDGGTQTPIGDFAIDRFRTPMAADKAKLKHEFDMEILDRKMPN
ncbi:FAD-binding oxidoreductase [Roseomonas sp. AR75]|uniref:NAD(P)/FAD-dependent oxidoreductase n=1 Tax=Roseomonas sp. AR75 TaxID=2562311 RepID=UPI0010BFE421|nr:FAD-dependent oxidoreductase [Roseomonas sp. AR75]